MVNDIILTSHFRLGEFITSPTAASKGITNVPALEHVDCLQQLCINVLEPLRSHFNCPIKISSGYRCPKLNAAVGGCATSQHMKGEAADIFIPNDDTGKKWFAWIRKNCKFDQLIAERSTASSRTWWIHVSWSRSRCRMQVIENLIKYK